MSKNKKKTETKRVKLPPAIEVEEDFGVRLDNAKDDVPEAAREFHNATLKHRQEVSTKKKKKKMENIILVALLILAAVMLFVLLKNRDNGSKKTESVPLYIDYNSVLSEEDLNKISECADLAGESLMSISLDDLFTGAGGKLPNIDLTTRDGKVVNLSKIEGPVVLEVIADWCTYCQMESQVYLEETMALVPEATFVQYMFTGSENEYQAFYSSARADVPENLIMVYANEELENWLRENDFASFPTFYLFNEGKVNGCVIGATVPSVFNGVANMAFRSDVKLYEVKDKNGNTIQELVRKMNIARNYVDQLEEIDVPVDLLYGE